ncbi:MAG: hypothetical protein U0797_15240 [Gemmataceae bacterium]
MIPNDPSLLDLARRVGQEAPLSSPRGREILESTLRPIVRVALRGIGRQTVVRWVRDRANADRPADPMSWAPTLASELCDRLLARLDPLPGRETVVGP